MWRIIIFVAYLLISSDHQLVQSKEMTLQQNDGPSLIMFDSEQLLGENKPSSTVQSSSSKPDKESTIMMTSIPTSLPSLPTTEVNSVIPANAIDTNENHHRITFDQRQEGQYNIRADLDNFMIVVIPPNPSAGVNLLDLLSRSTLKRSNMKKPLLNKKHFLDGSGKFNRPFGLMKNNHQQQQQQNINNYLSRSPYQFQPSQPVPDRFTDFIEGRTPYRVDISSNPNGGSDDNNSGNNDGNIYSTDTQIDVIPPPIPSNYHQLMKPYNLEVEPSIIQQHHHQHESSLQQQQQQQQQQTHHHQPTVLIPTLSQPSSASSSSAGFFSPNQGNLMDLLNRASGGRFSKSIKPQQFNNRNSIRILNSNGLNNDGSDGNNNNNDFNNYFERYNNKRDTDYYPYYMGITNDAIYPPLSFDSINNFNQYNKKLDNTNSDDYNNESDDNDDNISTASNNNNWEFKLIGATEQCGPDRVRDSYGVCQFIKNI